jgi:hypothetical protein
VAPKFFKWRSAIKLLLEQDPSKMTGKVIYYFSFFIPFYLYRLSSFLTYFFPIPFIFSVPSLFLYPFLPPFALKHFPHHCSSVPLALYFLPSFLPYPPPTHCVIPHTAAMARCLFQTVKEAYYYLHVGIPIILLLIKTNTLLTWGIFISILDPCFLQVARIFTGNPCRPA